MATIATPGTYYLDTYTGTRTAGETWSLSVACSLTVRTDTRWYSGAPASMTGSLGAITFSNSVASTFNIDGTNVRWMTFDSGSGTVPAINTAITQGSVTGTLLGVWSSITSAPSAVGSAMPTTGFLKFREVLGGSFVAGALSGVAANASSPDVTGWIEVMIDAASSVTLTQIATAKSRGSWFYLDSTTGSAGQTIQVPTNGGGANTSIGAVQIETSPGSGIFEWYPCVVANGTTTGWISTAVGTDTRSKMVQWVSGGQVRIGSDGTTTFGYVPPAGCKVRVPNIFLRQCAAASRATNALPSTTQSSRSAFNTSGSGGTLDLQNLLADWSFTTSNATNANISNCGIEGYLYQSGAKGITTYSNIGVGMIQTGSFTTPITITNSIGGTLSYSNIVVGICNASSSAYAVSIAGSANVTLDGITTLVPSTRTSAIGAVNISQSTNINANKITVIGGGISVQQSSSYVTLTNIDFTDRFTGTTSTTGGLTAITVSASSYVTVDGVSCGLNGTYNNAHPYAGWFSTSSSNNIKFRNLGTYASPVSSGSTSTLYPGTIYSTGGGAESQIKVQRCYVTGVRSGGTTSGSAQKGCLFEHVMALVTNLATVNIAGNDVTIRSSMGTVPASGVLNAAGDSWFDYFTSSTAGVIALSGSELSTASAPYVSLSDPAKAFFQGNGSVYLTDTTASVTFETPYYVKGHTGFSTTAFSQVGVGNLTYSLDKNDGNGYGQFKTLTAAALNAEGVLDPSLGFKLKVTVTGASNSGGAFTQLKINTTTSSSAQSTALYPLDTNTLSFTGLIPGSEVRVYQGTDPSTSVEIGGTESTGGSTFSFSHTSGGQAGTIVILAMGYQPIYLPYTFKAADDSILIQPVVDRNYNNPL